MISGGDVRTKYLVKENYLKGSPPPWWSWSAHAQCALVILESWPDIQGYDTE